MVKAQRFCIITKEGDNVRLFGSRLTLAPKQYAHAKILVPLAFIAICAIITAVMIASSFSTSAGLDGTFVLSGSDGEEFIEFDAGGSYAMNADGKVSRGEWRFDGGKVAFKPSSGEKQTARFIERKYIAFDNSQFWAGQIPAGSAFDAEVASKDGEVYTFKTDGKVYVTEDGRNRELGSYMVDGFFIIVTSEDESTTYLNCGDGITSEFYKAS